jgi:NADPH:quinone reductase-like Zn-dependent oxidoreductase
MKSALIMKPNNVTFEQAACVPIAALTALQGLRDKGRIQPGQKVLVNGAAGGVGTFAVQIAKSFGTDVTGVCSTRNVDMVRSIGADRVIDYTQEDFTTSGKRYDLLFDAVGNHPLSACRRALNPKGILIMVGAPSDASLMSILARLIGALCGVMVREPEASHLPGEIEHRGSDHRWPTLGNGEDNSGHRPTLQLE